MNRRLLTIQQTAIELNVSPPRVYDLIRQGLLRAVRLGRQIRIDSTVLEQFITTGGASLEGGWRRSAD